MPRPLRKLRRLFLLVDQTLGASKLKRERAFWYKSFAFPLFAFYYVSLDLVHLIVYKQSLLAVFIKIYSQQLFISSISTLNCTLCFIRKISQLTPDRIYKFLYKNFEHSSKMQIQFTTITTLLLLASTSVSALVIQPRQPTLQVKKAVVPQRLDDVTFLEPGQKAERVVYVPPKKKVVV